MAVEIIHGDCLAVMREMPEHSIDAVVTDPPYFLGFMSKNFDTQDGTHRNTEKMEQWHYQWTTEALKVAKPGAYMLAFGGTRTHHRLMCAIEDAGWIIKECVLWLHGQGFPKNRFLRDIGRPELGSALKPAYEPIILAQKPFSGTYAQNVIKWGCGALNINSCRLGWPDGKVPQIGTPAWGGPQKKFSAIPDQNGDTVERLGPSSLGRYPANVILSEEAAAELDEMVGNTSPSKGGGKKAGGQYGSIYGYTSQYDVGAEGYYNDQGGPSRYFYCAKASRAERGEGNTHPTVKPLSLMRYLCRLICPPGGTLLDPFAGSGSTLLAAMQEGFSAIGIEKEAEYIAIAENRLKKVHEELGLFAPPQEAVNA